MPTPTQDAVNDFLDALRDSGVTNMFGAVPYVQEAFDCTRAEASAFLSEWMRTFATRHPKEN